MKKSKTVDDREPEERKPSRGGDMFSDEEGLDEEIIDLEDIIELGLEDKGKGPHREDEIFSADEDLDLSVLDEDLDERDEDALEADLMKEFGFDEDFDSPSGLGKGKAAAASAADKGPIAEDSADSPTKTGEGIDSDFDFLLKGEEKDDFQELLEGKGEKGNLSRGSVPAPDVPETGTSSLLPPQEEPAALKPSKSADLDQLIDAIEGRLVQVIRDMVEARLPDLVRSLLREELENLRKDLEGDR